MSYDPNGQNIPSFGYGGGTFNLDLGEDTTGGIGGFQLIPEGVHLFQVVDFRVEYSKAAPATPTTKKKYQEPMIVLTVKIVRTSISEAMGIPKDEYIVLPDKERRSEDHETWQKMMKMLRLKLEALTGRPWREDNIQLNPQDLVGCFFIATAVHKQNSYTDKQGNQQVGKNAELNQWQAVHANSPQGAAQQTSPVAQQTAQSASSPQASGPQTVQQQIGTTPQAETAPAQQAAPATVGLDIGAAQQPANANPNQLGPWTPGEEPF